MSTKNRKLCQASKRRVVSAIYGSHLGFLTSTLIVTHIILVTDDSTSVLEIVKTLDSILDAEDHPYQATIYKNSSVNYNGMTAIAKYFRCKSRKDAVLFGRQLQVQHKILHHVCGYHDFGDDKYYLFHLQCYHQPYVLNSSWIWSHPVDPDCTNSILLRLKSLLNNKVIAKVMDHNGLVDDIQARQEAKYPVFEDAVCDVIFCAYKV